MEVPYDLRRALDAERAQQKHSQPSTRRAYSFSTGFTHQGAGSRAQR